MRFSEQWLREWVNPSVSTQELADQLTMAGLEVDAIEPVAGEFNNVVVAEVISLEKHPDADKLRVCQVNVGQKDTLTIVCGAANVAKGMKVPAALIGAKLPGDLKIKKSKLRGVESHGMLCSAKELGLAESAEGLLPLDEDAPVGEDIRKYLQLDDVSIELGLTPNRGDCLGIEGIAREVAVLNRYEVTPPKMPAVKAAIKDTFKVTLTASDDCPQYYGRVIRGINPAATTPLWMQEKLRRCGIRSLSAVVDVTNYVLLELGQPMHAFDLVKLYGHIDVRHATAKEKLTLLDGQSIDLLPGSLVIADAKGPVALAGIMGGEESAVSDSTTDIFLESAFFQPDCIAGKARRYGLHTDSSHRFERGVSPELQARAIERATTLLLAIAGGKAGPVIQQTVKNKLPSRQPVTLREARINRVLGTEVTKDSVSDVLVRLGMTCKSTGGQWKVTPPAFRFDISQEVDLIEEVGRIYGYGNLPVRRPQVDMVMIPAPEAKVPIRRIKQILVALGYQEAITYSFVDPQMQEILGPDTKPIALANPISAEMGVMRTNLWAGLLQAAQYNLHRQQNRLLLFEYGLKFVQQGTDLNQEMMLAGLLVGRRVPEQWDSPKENLDFYDVKVHLESLIALTGCSERFKFEPLNDSVLHPGQSASILRDGQIVGRLGALHPGVAKRLNLDHTMYLFEIKADSLQVGRVPTFQAVSRYPAIRRDLSIVVDLPITAEKVRECIQKVAPETLTKVELFDMYMGEGIDSGRKSLSLGLTLQDLSRTLTDNDVEEVMQRVIEQLHTDLGASLR